MQRTDYNTIAAEYKKAKQQPWRMHIEHFTLFGLLGNLTGKTVLDLACGEGFYTRFLKREGAARAVGVDISEKMIDLARQEEARLPLGVEYLVADAKDLDLPDRFDLVIAAYLLNYAASKEELLEMGQAVSRHLKPGGRFVTVNSNPDLPADHFADSKKYGLEKIAAGPLREGSSYQWRFSLDNGSVEITNYHLSTATHEWAFREAGFREVRWHQPRLSPTGEAENGREYWGAFLAHPPTIFIECFA